MPGAEVLARLNVKNCRFDVGMGGIPTLTPEMVAASCSGLPEVAYRLALVKYAGKREEVRNLKISTLILAAGLSVKMGWGKPVPGQLQGISDYAIWSVVGYHHCPRCNGAGAYKDQWRTTHTCFVCKGSGRASDATKEAIGQDVSGFGKEEWENQWRGRGNRLARHLSTADHRICRQIRYQLTDIAV